MGAMSISDDDRRALTLAEFNKTLDTMATSDSRLSIQSDSVIVTEEGIHLWALLHAPRQMRGHGRHGSHHNRRRRYHGRRA